MRTQILAIALLATGLAGCTEEPVELEPLAPAAPVWAPYAYNFTNDASGCNLGVAVVLRDMADLAAFLPEGYTPIDAQNLLGLPAATGQGAALFSIYTCADAAVTGGPLSGAEINILVDAPATPAAEGLTEATSNYYLLQMVAGDANLTAALADSEFDVLTGDALFRFNGVPPVFGSQGAVVVNETTYFVLNVPATAPASLDGLSRFWQETPNGTAHYDYEMTAEARIGHVACVFGDELVQAVAGGSGCTSGESFGITVADFSWTSTFNYLPHAAGNATGNATTDPTA